MDRNIDHYREWTSALDWSEQYLKENPQLRDSSDSTQEMRIALGLYKLRCFAIRMRTDPRSTWARPSNELMLRLYLINKHHWTPDEAAAATPREQDFVYLLHDELLALKLNEQEASPPKQWAHRFGRKSEFLQHFEAVD